MTLDLHSADPGRPGVLPAPAATLPPSGPLPVGLIGTGGFGRVHLRHLARFEEEGRARLLAVAEPGPAEIAASKPGLTGRGVRWYEDYRELLRAETGLRGLLIVAPIPLHLEMISAALDRDLFIHVEKPPVALIQDLDALIARDTDRRVSVGFQHIETLQLQTLKRWILEGRLGRIRQIAVTASWPRLGRYYRRPWAGRLTWEGRPTFDGPATNALSHLIHDIMFLAGPSQAGYAEPVSVRGELYRARPIESYDLACLRGAFGSGIRFLAALGHVTEQTRTFRIEVEGDRDRAVLTEDGVLESGATGPWPGARGGLADEACRTACEKFLSHAAGATQASLGTRLRDTRAYLLAVNGALVSSGGVRPIDPKYFRRYERDGEDGYDVPGLLSWMDRARREWLLFGELGAPWAGTPGREIDLTALRHLDLDPYLAGTAASVAS